MLRFAPILLAILYAVVAYHFSAWRTKRELDARSTELADPKLKALTDRMAKALDLRLQRIENEVEKLFYTSQILYEEYIWLNIHCASLHCFIKPVYL